MNKIQRDNAMKECDVLRRKISVYEARLNTLHILRYRAQTCDELSAVWERYIECESECMSCYKRLTKLEKEVEAYNAKMKDKKKHAWLSKAISYDQNEY